MRDQLFQIYTWLIGYITHENVYIAGVCYILLFTKFIIVL